VVKTKIQTDPDNYPGIVPAFKKLVKDRGIGGFFDGWAPTFVGFFLWGSASYSTTELLRRYFNDALGSGAIGLEVPIILGSSAIGGALSTFVLCPFESIRIRSVSQPDYGNNVFDVTARIIKVSSVCRWWLFLASAAPYTVNFSFPRRKGRSLYLALFHPCYSKKFLSIQRSS
jgi:solute carrier family 25 phosphate transporter 3